MILGGLPFQTLKWGREEVFYYVTLFDDLERQLVCTSIYMKQIEVRIEKPPAVIG